MSDHAWTQDHIAAYLAGGLDSAEAERFDAHVASCLPCTTALAEARRTDTALSSLFAIVHPGPTLEDRLLRSLRETPKPEPRGQIVWKLGGWKKKLAWGLAASLVLGTTGAMMSRLAEYGDLPFPGMDGFETPMSLVEGGWGDTTVRFDNAVREHDLTVAHASPEPTTAAKREAAPAPDVAQRWREVTTRSADGRQAGFQGGFGGGVQGGFGGGGFGGGGGGFGPSQGVPPAGKHASDLTRFYSLESNGTWEAKPNTNDFATLPSTVPPVEREKLQQKELGDKVTMGYRLDDRIAPLAEDLGKLVQRDAIPDDAKKAMAELEKAQQQAKEAGAEATKARGLATTLDSAQQYGLPLTTARPAPTPAPVVLAAPTTAVPPVVNYFIPVAPAAADDAQKKFPQLRAGVVPIESGEAKVKPDAARETRDAEGDKGEKGDGGGKKNNDPAASKPEGVPQPKAIPGADGQPAPGTGQPPKKVEAARKIIIRSGDVEYELESFDAAVTAITALTRPITGAFIATVNSEKLANGKVKGVVVVRTPPEALDGFMLDLRKELTKNGTGELKSQKLGSSDITKMYTDMESRLKGARAMEERLLKMIQEGKGDIKQLLEAERELGVWRTKIEELEGELRYYGSLAALSTLTITLVEREIRAAASMTECEVVQSGVEVEDVDTAFREATKAIFDAKGRITKSELKQLTGGQYTATLNFEVAPEQSGAIRDRLKQLGRVARLEINRVITAEGTPVKGLLPKRGDTQFFVQFYNLANIAPRETATAAIAVTDVPAAYATLRTAIEKAKGRVINAQLNETDKANVSATLDFEVKRPEDGAVQLAMQGVGETLSRNVTRAAESDTVTDTKVLFRLTLTNANRLTPRETTTVAVAVPDLPTSYKAVLEAVEKAKGRILTSNLNETDRQNVNAQIDFEAKRSDEMALLTAFGTNNEILSRSTTRVPDATNVTDSKVLFRVTMSSLARLQPSETVSLIVAVTDIPAGYKSVLASVEKQKGRVVTASLNEGDQQNVTAQLDFEVKRGEEPTVAAAVGPNGDVLSRKSVQSPAGTHVTESKVLIRVTFVNALRLKPRETATLAIEVENVDTTAAAFGSYVSDAKGRVVDSQVAAERDGRVTARLVYDLPLAAAPGVIERFKKDGKVRVQQSARDPQASDGKFAIARLDVTLSNQDLIVSPDSGVGPQVRKGLSFSLTALLSSLSWLIFGLFVILPWALIGYAAYRLVRYLVRKPAPTPEPIPVPVTTPTS